MTDTLTATLKTTPSVVEVKFLIPGAGSTIEKYNLFSMHDILCWKLNSSPSRTKAIQLGVSVLEEVEANEDNLYALTWERAWAENLIMEKAYGEVA